MAYTLEERVDLMLAPRRQNYLVLEMDRSMVNSSTFYNLTVCVERTFGQKRFTYTWIALTKEKLILFVSGSAIQLDYIEKYLLKRITCQTILETNSKSQFSACVDRYAGLIPKGSYVGVKFVGGTHFARVGVAA